MSTIKYAFGALPKKGPYTGVIADLARRSLPLPAKADDVSREALVAHLQGVCGDLIAKEIASNKTLYEAAKFTDDQIALVVQRAGVLGIVPYAPNLLTADDIAAARG